METVSCKALMAFTHYVPDYGQVHGDPENEEAKTVNVPLVAVKMLVEDGRIAKPKGLNSVGEIESEKPVKEKPVVSGLTDAESAPVT